MGGGVIDAESELVVIWGDLPADQIANYHDQALYLDQAIWRQSSVAQRWEVIDGLRGLSISDEMQYHAHGNPAQLERDNERLARIQMDLWTTLVELEAVVDGLCAQTRVVLVA